MADSRSVLKSVRRNERSCAFWGIGVPPPPAGLTVKFDKAGNVSQRSPGLSGISPASANSPVNQLRRRAHLYQNSRHSVGPNLRKILAENLVSFEFKCQSVHRSIHSVSLTVFALPSPPVTVDFYCRTSSPELSD